MYFMFKELLFEIQNSMFKMWSNHFNSELDVHNDIYCTTYFITVHMKFISYHYSIVFEYHNMLRFPNSILFMKKD